MLLMLNSLGKFRVNIIVTLALPVIYIIGNYSGTDLILNHCCSGWWDLKVRANKNSNDAE